MLIVICDGHNYELCDSLIGHPYATKLKLDEHFMVIDITNSLVKSTNILLNMKEHDKDNVTTIRQIYSDRYACKRSIK